MQMSFTYIIIVTHLLTYKLAKYTQEFEHSLIWLSNNAIWDEANNKLLDDMVTLKQRHNCIHTWDTIIEHGPNPPTKSPY